MTRLEFQKQYVKIVVPLMLQGMVTTLVAMVDTLMVGQLGDNAISAVSISNRILGILTMSLFGIASATGVFIAQYYGAKNTEKQQEVFRISLLMSFTACLIAAVIIGLFPHTIVHFFVQVASIETVAVDYILIMLVSYIPFSLTMNYGTTLKVIGQVRVPLFASLVGVGVNTCLNYVLIFGQFNFPALGVKGAAIATVIARIVECLILYTFTVVNRYDFQTKWVQMFHITKQTTLDVFKKAVPLCSNEIIWAFGMATILKIYATRGSEVIAAYAIADATSTLFFSIAQAMNAATDVFISQQLGANHFDKAFQNAKWMLQTAFIAALFLGMGMFTASFIVPNFYQVSPVSHDIAKTMIQIMAFMYWVYLVTVQCYYTLRSGGDMKSTLIMDGLFMWVVTIPVMASVAYLTPVTIFVIYLAGQACDLLKLATALYFFFKKRWLQNLAVNKIL